MAPDSIPQKSANDLAQAKPGLNSKGGVLDPGKLLEAHGQTIDFERLHSLSGKSILGVEQLSRDSVIELCKFSAL
ncbi:MAG TPA: hypothetical protein VKA63_00905, partial [Candidatus Krumholzibacteria bacterium]|nr:hypothetical protein [Candidatus Krumholzibacteria bacterium]